MTTYEVTSYVALAIPVFFALIGIELLIAKMKKVNLYRFNDTITNLSCGIGQQILGVFLKTTLIFLYIYLYENKRLIGEIPNTALTWVLLFIGVDFFYYWFHRLAHEISVIWATHVVHHQSEEYNLSVALRQSWFQGFFSMLFYLPLAYIGFHPVMFLIVSQFQLLYQFWIHTKVIEKMPAWYEYVFNTPSHHRVHHGQNPLYIDRNHGGTLIIFDRIFGTFQPEVEAVVYGITTPSRSWNPLWVNLEFWAYLGRQLKKMHRLPDFFKTLFFKPGWQPNYLGGTPEFKVVTPNTFQKFDAQAPAGLNQYIFLQYIILLSATSGFLFGYNHLSTFYEKLLCGGIIIWAIINLGALFEQKRWGWVSENLRLMFSVVLLYVLNTQYGFLSTPVCIALMVVYLSVSSIWLNKHKYTIKN